MIFKRGKKESKLAFENLPTDKALDVLLSITADIEAIVKDERLRPILTKESPFKGATGVDINNLVIEKGAEKLSELLRYFLQAKRDNVYNILAALTVTDRATYGEKPFTEMLADIKLIMHNSEITSFFSSAVK